MGLWGALGAGRAFLGGGGKLTDQTLTASHLEGHLQPRSILAPFSFLPAVNRYKIPEVQISYNLDCWANGAWSSVC